MSFNYGFIWWGIPPIGGIPPNTLAANEIKGQITTSPNWSDTNNSYNPNIVYSGVGNYYEDYSISCNNPTTGTINV